MPCCLTVTRSGHTQFKSDAKKAFEADNTLTAFVFFTNVCLSSSEKSGLTTYAMGLGFKHVDIYDRDRLRLSLDNPDGLSIRFQYLQLPLSEAEQAAFFSKWGDEVQGVISEGFGRIERSLGRLQFLAEMDLPLTSYVVRLELDKEYTSDEIGHFRAFCHLNFVEPIDEIFGFNFWVADRPKRTKVKRREELEETGANGIASGYCGGQWTFGFNIGQEGTEELEKEREANENSFSASGRGTLSALVLSYKSDFLIRLPPYFKLRSIDESMVALFVNESLAAKIKSLAIFANEYKLAEFPVDRLSIDPHGYDSGPILFSDDELKDKWVRIMSNVGAIRVMFSYTTPRRMFDADCV